MGTGLTAPDGYVWCRSKDSLWHFLTAAELTHQGKTRQVGRSVCGLWGSLPPRQDGWVEILPRVTPEPGRMCPTCLASVADAQRRDRLVAPTVGQGRLFDD